MSDSMTVLTYDDVPSVGEVLHDQWEKIAGNETIERGSVAWADMVKFAARTTRARNSERPEKQDARRG